MFDKALNLFFLTTILMLTTMNSNQNPISTVDNITAVNSNEKPDFSLVQILKSNNKSNSSDAKIFDYLLEEMFSAEDYNDKSWLNSEYSKLLRDLNSQEEENYFSSLMKENTNQDSLILIDEKENQEKLLKSFCSQEKLDLEEKLKNGENQIFNLELDRKNLSKELVSFENKINTNEENLKMKTEEIANQTRELNSLKNPSNNNKNSNSETLILIESLISLVKSYYNNLENSREDKAFDNAGNSEKLVAAFIQIAGKAEKLKDYSLATYLSELANRHLKGNEKGGKIEISSNFVEYKSEIKNKILEAFGNLKKNYEKKQREIEENLQSEIALKEKSIQNIRELVELISEEILTYKKDLMITKRRLESVVEALDSFKNNIEKLKEIMYDLNKICS